MNTDAISPLRQRMIEDMNARELCAGTQKGHIRSCRRFAAFLKRSPDTATAEDIRLFQLHLAETGLSICNRNRIMTGLPTARSRVSNGSDGSALTLGAVPVAAAHCCRHRAGAPASAACVAARWSG